MRLQVSSYLSTRLSVLKEQRDSHQKDFRGISYLGLLLKIVDTFLFYKAGRNKRHPHLCNCS
jgi:hypothetical protein